MSHEVSELDTQPEVGYTRHELGAILSTPRVNRHMVFTPICLQSLLHSDIERVLHCSLHRIYFTLMDGVAAFAVHHSIDCNIGFRMRGQASVFTAKLAAICMAMEHIENEALGWCFT
jgi:hypothetical protein